MNSRLAKLMEPIQPLAQFIHEETGEELFYDACSSCPDAYDPKVFEYIGYGRVSKINGKPQISINKYHFWRYRKMNSTAAAKRLRIFPPPEEKE